jgi:hypothetical protein
MAAARSIRVYPRIMEAPHFSGTTKKPRLLDATGVDIVAGEEGFEPSHAGIKIQCLNQLGDSPAIPQS